MSLFLLARPSIPTNRKPLRNGEGIILFLSSKGQGDYGVGSNEVIDDIGGVKGMYSIEQVVLPCHAIRIDDENVPQATLGL